MANMSPSQTAGKYILPGTLLVYNPWWQIRRKYSCWDHGIRNIILFDFLCEFLSVQADFGGVLSTADRKYRSREKLSATHAVVPLPPIRMDQLR